MKRVLSFVVAALMATAGPALAANFEFHGDLNNRFLVYTDQAGLFTLDKASSALDDDDREDSFASFKYRLWTEASTNDGNVKGVYAVEIGAVRFGNSGKGGAFSGDGVNIETRWAYTDFQLPNVDSKARVRIGLQPWKVSPYFWNETATAVTFSGDNLTLGWGRGSEKITGSQEDWGDGDVDSILARWDHKGENFKVGVFGNYTWEDSSATFTDLSGLTASVKDLIAGYAVKKLPEVEMDLAVLGVDGSWTSPTGSGNIFANWDLIYQTGSLDNVSVDGGATIEDLDVSAYLAHIDLGANVGATRFTYTLVYASGDDDVTDDDLEGFLTVDVDRFDSIVLQEGGYTDDFYFTERPVIGPYGVIMNKLAVDHKASDKLKFGAAALYWMTAEDVEYVDSLGAAQSNDDIGVEFDAYVSYMIYPNVEFAVNAGYLVADDVMDIYDTVVDGDADNDVFRSTARVRYKF